MSMFKSEKMETIVLRKVYLLDEIAKTIMTAQLLLKEATIDSGGKKPSWADVKHSQEIIADLNRHLDHVRTLNYEAEKESRILDMMTPAYLTRVIKVVTDELGLVCSKEKSEELAKRLILEKNLSQQNITAADLIDLGLLPAATSKQK